MGPLPAARFTVGRAVELPLRRQAQPAPRGIGRGLVARHVDRPGRRQRHRLEHAAPRPRAAALLPEQRVHAPRRLLPAPRRRSPQLTPAVAAGLDKGQVVGVGDVIALNLERRHIDRLGRKLVVPAEGRAAGHAAERGPARCDRHHRLRRGRTADRRRCASRPALAAEVEPVTQVEQRLLVHHLVLQQRVHALGAAQHRVGVVGDSVGLERRQQRAVGALHIVAHRVTRRPAVDGDRGGRLPVIRIYAAREQLVEFRIDTTSPPSPLRSRQLTANAGMWPS